MYIAASPTKRGGHYLGDVLLEIRLAWEWWRREPADHVILSLHSDGKELNFLWDAFIETVKPTIVWDSFDPSDHKTYWNIFDERRKTRQVDGLHFDIYKELYLRIDGGARQHALCGLERGLNKRNILEYYWFGQESHQPGGVVGFGPGIIKTPRVQRQPRIFIAPHEKCYGNRVFTLDFWREVVRQLANHGIPITINTQSPDLFIHGKNIECSFEPYQTLVEQLAGHILVACGNTGIGWAAGAVGVPVIACESPDMFFWEFSYRRTGLATLVDTIAYPDASWCARRILDEWNSSVCVQSSAQCSSLKSL